MDRQMEGRDEYPTFFSTDPADPDPDLAQQEKNSGSGSDSRSDLKSKWRKKYIYILGRYA